MTIHKVTNIQKDIQTKLAKKLLDLIILQLLRTQAMHGYEVIAKIRKTFGVYFGPSTIYPLLSTLERKKCISSNWNMDGDRPRKVYQLTEEGNNVLNISEDALNLICQKMTPNSNTNTTANTTDSTESPPNTNTGTQ
ncbi:MAG: PadR family transcriptional regulator [Nitrososphaerota archaeon]|jgi:DNA-binding PadR family transcriptional regulator|uniref:PadR family transcriptional regulator n=1 Tax=Candidatus Bathycorpusculum sp. TaxID=2994959 RepID=UPI00282FFF83|nr:PadR family transcriptional regulator [Candidatus Termiticorpusculum sp.]MCL2257907.1 PadR family transcriptional regulator [Candidatus Termiticorpusculum sp.]MCL2291954.1 PadR family transcriptional regulator [Candidatus Termiticorpusculum sp.]MDR0460114.1 PadR family transcriptional regulator [Nitrososphaerota archaeon]